MKYLKFANMATLMMLSASTEAFHKEEKQYVPKDDTNRKTIYPNVKQGQKTFTYPDGFECYALNQKNADKKHRRWKDQNQQQS